MRMKIAIGLVAVLVFSIGAASGQDDPIKTRQDLMKSLGPSLRTISQMLNGEQAFDPKVAEAAMLKVADDAKVLPTLFPVGSDEGSDASPVIWTQFEQFTALYAELGTAASEGAKAAAANDLEGVRTAFGAVGQACGACHQLYRKS